MRAKTGTVAQSHTGMANPAAKDTAMPAPRDCGKRRSIKSRVRKAAIAPETSTPISRNGKAWASSPYGAFENRGERESCGVDKRRSGDGGAHQQGRYHNALESELVFCANHRVIVGHTT
jgi:hypothetical protein